MGQKLSSMMRLNVDEFSSVFPSCYLTPPISPSAGEKLKLKFLMLPPIIRGEELRQKLPVSSPYEGGVGWGF